MLRRFSASGLAFVMIAIIALRFPALAFCLCDQHLILNDGTCCVEAPSQADRCEDCEDCEHDALPPEPVPCDDCVVVLRVEPGDFFWLNVQFSPAPEIGTAVMLPVGLQDEARPSSQPGSSAGPIRGSPPWRASGAMSRTQVLKL